MNAYEFPSAKLLYLANEMFKFHMINEVEKAKLKGIDSRLCQR